MRRPPLPTPSRTKMADAALSPGPLQSELEVLQAIFLDDMTVTHEDGRPHPWQVTVHLAPATGEDPALGFVRLSLHLQLQHSYPCSTPLITISNPRGFSEQQIDGLVETLRILAQQHLGSAVLFQLVQVAKEALTTINSCPHSSCTICLHSLQV
ncbi:E3 ubiquitin-protein ligase RNF25, partial [Lampetra planeri]